MTPQGSDDGWSELHGQAVREAAPEVPAFSAGELAAVWRQIEASAPEPEPGRSRWKIVVAGIAAVVAIGGAGAATADVFSAHTGRGPSDAEDVELGGPGERLDPAAPDFAAVAEEVTTDIRFPSTQSRERALSWEVQSLSRDGGSALVSTGALRLWTAGHALCAWSNTWAVALRDGDVSTQRHAADVIFAARNWPSITDTDPGLGNESEFAWLPDLEQAVRSEDPSGARAALFPHGACMPGLAPELGLGKRW